MTPGSQTTDQQQRRSTRQRLREYARLGLFGAVVMFTGRGTSLPFRDRLRIFRGARVLGRRFGVAAALEIAVLCGRLAGERRLGEEGAVELLERAAALAVDHLPTPQTPEGVKLLLPFYADAMVYVERYDTNRQPPIALRRAVTAAEAIHN